MKATAVFSDCDVPQYPRRSLHPHTPASGALAGRRRGRVYMRKDWGARATQVSGLSPPVCKDIS